MNFKESITLDTYSNNASNQFNEMQRRLSKIENSFQTRMNGKTIGGLVGSFIGTLLWLGAYIVGAVMVKEMIDSTAFLITVIAVMGLLAFMLIDNIINFSYYGKISNYKNAVYRLHNRVDIGRSSIKSNHDAFMSSKSRGWNYLLNAGTSIPEEATTIETTLTNMESIRTGFVNGVKNVFFYATAVIITLAGCYTLFSMGGEIMIKISGSSIPNNTKLILNIIALVITMIIEIILAKLVWGKTDCRVTNVTLFIMPLGPIIYLALIAVATLLVILAISLVQIVLYILGVVIVGGIVIGCLCGG